MGMNRQALSNVSIRPLREEELAAADRMYRRSFGTFLGLADPETFGADSDFLGSRFRSDPARVFAAEHDGELVGTNVASNWGSLGYFGPLTVSPEHWGRGVGQALVGAAMQQFAAWGNSHTGLFSFSNSPMHLHLYEKFGFYPRFLTVAMSKAVGQETGSRVQSMTYGELTGGERAASLCACRDVTGSVFPGLDLSGEIEAVQRLRLGDTVLLLDGDELSGLAICHCGPRTEAAQGECYVKFGTVRAEATAGPQFTNLLGACEAFAASRGLEKVSAGVNLACDAAYMQMQRSGFRTDFVGVAMQKPNGPACFRTDRHVIADWL